MMNNVLNDEIIGFSPLMNIDKLILSRLIEGIGSAADHA